MIGGDFTFEELAAILRADPDLVVGALDELWRRQILSESAGRYDFSHDMVREVAAAGVSGPRRRGLHANIADGLLAAHGADRCGRPRRSAPTCGRPLRGVDLGVPAGGPNEHEPVRSRRGRRHAARRRSNSSPSCGPDLPRRR